MAVGAWDLTAVLVKTLLYASTFGAAGGAFFLSLNRAVLEETDRRVIGRWIEICFAAAVAASALRIMATAGALAEGVSGMWDPALIHLVWRTGEDSATITRIAGLLLAVRAALSARPAVMTAGAGAAFAAISFAWVGHAHASGSALTVACLALHLAGAAFWIGALVPLALLARGSDAPKLGEAAARFGAAAVPVVLALVLAGGYALWRFLGRPANLGETTYGLMMCAKLAFAAALVGLAAYNKLRLTPRLLAGDGGAVVSLRRSIHAELAAAGLVLVATAALTTLTGPPALG